MVCRKVLVLPGRKFFPLGLKDLAAVRERLTNKLKNYYGLKIITNNV